MRSNVVFRPTVVIGLGGTGHSSVLKLKKRFIDAYGAVPPIIRFLSIDTTENSQWSERTSSNGSVMLEPNEQYVLQVINPGALVSGANEHIDEWWPKDIPISAIVAGAGQVRARGRLALFAKSSEVFARIRNAIDDVQNIKNTRQMYADQFLVSERGGLEIYLVGSLAGGTGSGIFLDIAFISRSMVDTLSNVTGVFVLPRLFSNLPGTQLVKPNAYGALKEIEYFSKMKPSDQFEINYGTATVNVEHPPFDLLYVLDSVNENGKVISELSDLTGLIADGLYIQIGSQIGTNSSNSVDNIKTHLTTAGLVRGRLPSYCSFGVASLTLPLKAYESMQIDAARKLVSDGLLNGVYHDQALETEVVRFIEDHGWREDDADDVIDAISTRDGGGQMRFQFPLGSVKFDRNALQVVRNLHTTYRTRTERQIAQGMDGNLKQLKERSITVIESWWESALNRPNGLTYAHRFAEKLLAKLEWYQQMMESEAKDHSEKLKTINFRAAEEQVKTASGAWLGLENKVRTACEEYKGVVEREFELNVEIERRNRASEFYSTLRNRVEALLAKCERIRHNLESCLKGFEREYIGATSLRGASSLFEHTVRLDMNANRPEITAEDFTRWLIEIGASASSWAEESHDEIARTIELFITERFSDLTEMPIEQVLARSTPEEIANELDKVANLAAPLWKYDEGRIPVVNRGVITELYHYGVYDSDATLLQEAKIASRIPRKQSAPAFVSTRDPKRITIFKVKVGVPLFALVDVEEMELAYQNPDKVVSNHLHRHWESFPNVIPRGGDGESLRWFAIAQAPHPFNFITRKGEWYYARSQQAKRTNGGELRLGQGRVNAYQAFDKNKGLIKEIEEAVDAITRSVGESQVTEVLRGHADQLASQMSNGNVDPTVKEHVEGEIEAIEEHLKRMTTLR